MKITLAEALLRRKELQNKVDQLKMIKDRDFFETRASRKQVTENIDDIIINVPKLTLSQFTAEYDFYAKALRLIDAVIQQTNWTVEVEVNEMTMKNFTEVKQ